LPYMAFKFGNLKERRRSFGYGRLARAGDVRAVRVEDG